MNGTTKPEGGCRVQTGIALAASLALGCSALIAPPPREPASIDIAYHSFVLDNGLRLIVHEDHKAPIVAVNVWYHVGSKNERLGRTGFATSSSI